MTKHAWIVFNTSSFYIQNFKPLPSFFGYAGGFVSYLVPNHEDRFSRDEAQIHLTGVNLFKGSVSVTEMLFMGTVSQIKQTYSGSILIEILLLTVNYSGYTKNYEKVDFLTFFNFLAATQKVACYLFLEHINAVRPKLFSSKPRREMTRHYGKLVAFSRQLMDQIKRCILRSGEAQPRWRIFGERTTEPTSCTPLMERISLT